MIEEGEDQIGLQIRQTYRRRRFTGALLNESEKQHQRIAVAGDGARTHGPLEDEVLGEELLHQAGEGRRLWRYLVTHGPPPATCALRIWRRRSPSIRARR